MMNIKELSPPEMHIPKYDPGISHILGEGALPLIWWQSKTRSYDKQELKTSHL